MTTQPADLFVIDGMLVHWWFGTDLCEDYVTGDTVTDLPEHRSAVTCRECLEWIHA